MRSHKLNYWYTLSAMVALVASVFLIANTYAADEFSWKSPQKGARYTATFKDSAGNEVIGDFGSEIKWERERTGKVDIEDWDKKATFRYRGADGSWHYIKNDEVKKGIVSLNPDFTGTLSGNIMDYPAELHPKEMLK